MSNLTNRPSARNRSTGSRASRPATGASRSSTRATSKRPASASRATVRPGTKTNGRANARPKLSLQAARLDRSSVQITDLLYQALETELGGIQVYTTAISLAQNPDLRREWSNYLEQTRNHERILLGVFEAFGLDPENENAARKVVRQVGECLVNAMEMARRGASPASAECVAAECVVLAETKDHMNWELIGEVSKGLEGKFRTALKEAHDEVEDEEDEHLYHTMGWCRELWLQYLGLPAVLPPPEEKKKVKTALGAAKAKGARKQMLPKGTVTARARSS